MIAVDESKREISIVIPTYHREGILLETLESLLSLDPAAAEILVVDQTKNHEPDTEQQLNAMHASGRIRWLRLDRPSIPAAMNRGLIEARERLVLFLDDDIRPEADLLAAHCFAHLENPGALIAGRVIQPWEEGASGIESGQFGFSSARPAWIEEFMGGNFSIAREVAISIGGFDENFVRVAYRFEAEFAHRLRTSGHRIRFGPRACIHHLKAEDGGTRKFGNHLRTWSPAHAVGAYYFALRTMPMTRCLREFVSRPLRAVATRHHLRRPWWIPATLLAEAGGMIWALRLAAGGPRLLKVGK